MKIAVTAETNNGLESTVAQHFGHAPYFMLVDVENGEVTATQGIANPFAEGHATRANSRLHQRTKRGRNIERRHGWARHPVL